MIKEVGGLAGGALIFSPIGMPFLLHGVAGVIVGGAGLFVADAVLKQVVDTASNLVSQAGSKESGEQDVQ